MSEHSEEHGSVKTYVVILTILGVVTLAEVATYFIPWFQQHTSILFWSLSVMALGKFALVVGYYMHLRYDAAYYTRVFVAPMVLAVAMVVVVAVMTGLRHVLFK